MLLAQQDNRPLIEFTTTPLFTDNGIPLAVMGILVVFVALVLIAVVITLLPRVFGESSANAAAAPMDLSPAEGDELSEELVVVIAAAVAETIRSPHRIVRIGGLSPQHPGWSLEGRMQHHQSHNLPHRDQR